LSATLPSLLAVPIGLAIVKAAVDRIPKDTEPIVPIVPTLPPDPVAPRPIIPLPDPGPSKIRIDIPEGIIPFFPKQTGLPPKGVNIDPTKFPKIGDLSTLKSFDPRFGL